MPQSVQTPPERPPLIDYNALLQGPPMTHDEVETADAAVLRVYVRRLEGAVGSLIDRDGEWESRMTAAETRPNTMLGLIGDGNRCSQTARGLPVAPHALPHGD